MAYGGRNRCTAGSFSAIVRTTVLIGPDQRIARVWPKVSVAGHAEEVLAAAESL